MKAAIAVVQAKTMSIQKAAKTFNVSSSALFRRTNGRYKFSGPTTVLTAAEEKQIANWVIDVSKRGFSLTRTELKECVQMYLNKAGRTTIFKENRPGRKWMDAFLKRQPILSIRLAENIDKSRASVTESMIRDWFLKVCSRIFHYYVIPTVKLTHIS